MLIDTHCHLDASEFDADREKIIADAQACGVTVIVIPAVARANFDAVRDLAHALEQGAYALGIHPLAVPHAREEDLADLDARLSNSLSGAAKDARLVAMGEIGLDFFVPTLTQAPMRARQEFFYTAQLDMARRYNLPVLLHVRRAQDVVLKHLRRRPCIGGIAHAFNGSFQQARQFMAQGFVLGIGGTVTYARALQIRRLAAQLPLSALVLETDAPDIAPAWLACPDARPPRNTPAQLARIAQELAQLRGLGTAALAAACAQNARRALPRLDALLAGVQAAKLSSPVSPPNPS